MKHQNGFTVHVVTLSLHDYSFLNGDRGLGFCMVSPFPKIETKLKEIIPNLKFGPGTIFQ